MDWRELLHNRWVWVGAAGAAGLGAIVWYRRRGTSAGGGSGSQDSPAYASGSVGSFDSTGTDVAAWLGNYSANLDSQLSEFRRTIEQQLGSLQPPGDAPPPGDTTYPSPAPRRYNYQPIIISGDTSGTLAPRR